MSVDSVSHSQLALSHPHFTVDTAAEWYFLCSGLNTMAENDWSNVCDKQLDQTDLPEIKSELVPIQAKWEDFALQLGILFNTIKTIKLRNLGEPATCLNEVLSEWLSVQYDTKKHGHPCWRKLCKATASPAGGNNKALALNIAERHVKARMEQTDSDEQPVTLEEVN